MPSSPDKAWFRRRKYGLGWALQKTWQGWLLIAVYAAFAAAGLACFDGQSRPFTAYMAVLTVLATLLCWWKGERSLWRGHALDLQTDTAARDLRRSAQEERGT